MISLIILLVMCNIDVSLGGFVKITNCAPSFEESVRGCALSIDGIDESSSNYWSTYPQGSQIHHAVFTLERSVLLNRIRIVHGVGTNGGLGRITSFTVEVTKKNPSEGLGFICKSLIASR